MCQQSMMSQLDRKLLDRAGVGAEPGMPPELGGASLALVGDFSDNVPRAQGAGRVGRDRRAAVPTQGEATL